MLQERPRVLVYVDLDLVGDALIKLPMLRALRHAMPAAEVVWVAGRGASAFSGPLAPLAGWLIDRVIERSGAGQKLRAALGPGRPALVMDTQGRLSSALGLLALRPRRFVSVALQSTPPRRLISRLLALLESATGQAAVPGAALRLPGATEALAETLLPAGPVYVAQAIGAGGKHKAWPVERHVALARALDAAGRVPVMILGPDEAGQYGELAAALPFARFPLQEAQGRGAAAGPDLTIALAARCAAGVAGDCGGGHMLAAAVPWMVSLFGPTSPEKFAPWSAHPTIIRAQDFGGREMDAIPVEPVLAALLASGGG